MTFVAGTTTATVTAVTVAGGAVDLDALTAQVEAANAGTASTAAAAGVQIYDVTLTAALADGTTRIAIINDDTAAIASTDTLIDVTGIDAALTAADFTFI